MCGMLFDGNTWHLQFSDRLDIRVNRSRIRISLWCQEFSTFPEFYRYSRRYQVILDWVLGNTTLGTLVQILGKIILSTTDRIKKLLQRVDVVKTIDKNGKR